MGQLQAAVRHSSVHSPCLKLSLYNRWHGCPEDQHDGGRRCRSLVTLCPLLLAERLDLVSLRVKLSAI